MTRTDSRDAGATRLGFAPAATLRSSDFADRDARRHLVLRISVAVAFPEAPLPVRDTRKSTSASVLADHTDIHER
jgi:hypothetical protein